jgi:hypothetical protein
MERAEAPLPHRIRQCTALRKQARLLEDAAEAFRAPNKVLRRRVVAKITAALRTFVSNQHLFWHGEGLSDEAPDCMVLTSGSEALGVAFPSSDIDAVCFFRRPATELAFFREFPEILTEVAGATDAHTISARVPIVAATILGVEVDILACRCECVPRTPADTARERFVRSLTPVGLASASGLRLVWALHSLVINMDTFRTTLRMMRLWAKKKKIGSNKHGGLGGVNLALIVARACEAVPFSGPLETLFWCFYIIVRHPWPTPLEISIVPREVEPERLGAMPMLLPLWPFQDSMAQASTADRVAILQEAKRALDTLTAFLNADIMSVADLFRPANLIAEGVVVAVLVWADDHSRCAAVADALSPSLRHLNAFGHGSDRLVDRAVPATREVRLAHLEDRSAVRISRDALLEGDADGLFGKQLFLVGNSERLLNEDSMRSWALVMCEKLEIQDDCGIIIGGVKSESVPLALKEFLSR